MPRNMSFSLTTEQVRNKTKTVTRRDGWWFLKPGDIVNACEKCMGLKKGQRVKRICQIRIKSTSAQPLHLINEEDVTLEGFPYWGAAQFVRFFVKTHPGVSLYKLLNRIEFEYI